jgi:hypothetical protein
MTPSALAALAADLAAHPSIRGKRDIAVATGALGVGPSDAGRPGDDAAALPRPEGGWDLFAAEAFIPAFVADDPWFAGWCGVMVNLSDVAAMGGRATALTDMIWAPDAAAAAPLLAGLRAAAAAYGVPIVGGHTNLAAPALNLAVAVTGRAERLISGHGARAGDLQPSTIAAPGDRASTTGSPATRPPSACAAISRSCPRWRRRGWSTPARTSARVGSSAPC